MNDADKIDSLAATTCEPPNLLAELRRLSQQLSQQLTLLDEGYAGLSHRELYAAVNQAHSIAECIADKTGTLDRLRGRRDEISRLCNRPTYSN